MGEPILVTHNILINHMGTISVVLFLHLGDFMNIIHGDCLEEVEGQAGKRLEATCTTHKN